MAMNNYIEFTLGEKVIGLKFGLPAVRRVHEVSEKYELQDSSQTYNALGMAHILYAGYLNNCLIKEAVPEDILPELIDYFEEGYFQKEETDVWQRGMDVLAFFAGSFVVKSLLETAKKKMLKEAAATMTPTTNPNQSPEPQPIGTESKSSVMDSSG